jgi:hypothetical protein
MNRGLVVLLLAASLGGFGYFHFKDRGWNVHRHPAYGVHPPGHHPEMDWLRREIGVPEERMGKVIELHEAYHPKLEDLTRRLADSSNRLAALAYAGKGSTSQLEQALKDDSALRLEARTAMLNHLFETATSLTETEAKRYLDVMVPHAIDGNSATTETAHSHPHP